MQGNIVWFNNTKGYGFIKPSEGDKEAKDVFVHISGVTPKTKLSEHQPVMFDLVECSKGVQAINVKKTSNIKVGG